MSSSDTPSALNRRSFLLGTLALSALDYDAVRAESKSETPKVIRGPYVQRTTAEGTVLMWRTDVESTTRVRYGTRRGRLDREFVSGGLETDHIARIIGLEPNTKYYYEIGTADELLVGGDQSYHFFTAPEIGSAKPTRILALGDIGWPTGELRNVRDQYYSFTQGQHTDVCLLLGDIAYSHGRDEEYQAPLFDMFSSLVRKTATWPAYGNHDSYCSTCDSRTDTGPYFDIFKSPTLAQAGGFPSYTRAYYSFDYGNIHFISLNSTDWQQSKMVEWLHTDLGNTDSKWTIAFWHHPAYSRGAYNSDVTAELVQMREVFMPILEDHGIDLILTGHNHCYERSFLIDSHYGTAETLKESMILNGGNGNEDGYYKKPTWGRQPHEGTIHAALGNACIIKDGPLDHPVMCKSVSDFGALVIDIVENQLHAQMINDSGTVIDRFTIQKGSRNYFPIAG